MLKPESLPVTGNTTLTQPENRAFYPALDGLRAVAFLLVFSQHYLKMPWGWSGVNIFFVLSGFLITGILFDSRHDPHRARNFYIRRALRIFPLFYAVFFVILLFQPVAHWNWSVYWLAWPLYVANFLPFLSSDVVINGSTLQLASYASLHPAGLPKLIFFFNHFWSLCVEEQFYFIWPWIVFWTRSRRALIWICSSAVILVPISRVIFQHIAPTWMLLAGVLERATLFQIDALLLGGLIALLMRGPLSVRLHQAGKVVAFCAGLLAVCILVSGIMNSFPDWRAGYPYPDWEFTWGFTIINLLSAGIIILALQPANFIHRVLRIRTLRWMGRISYGAYVFHDIFHNVYIAIVHGIAIQSSFVAKRANLFVGFIGLVFTLLISWLSFDLFESRFLNLKERWTIQPDTRGSES